MPVMPQMPIKKTIDFNVMKYNQPYLERYTGPRSRHECPACHDKQSFTYYLDGNTEQVIDKTVGRCNRESKCGYHYPPREYFKSNPSRSNRPLLIPWPEEWGPEYETEYDKPKDNKAYYKPEPPRKPDFIPDYYLKTFAGYGCNFMKFLSTLFDDKTANELRWRYRLGCTENRSVIYWQIDIKDRIRTGKIMQYDRKTGKRIKKENGAIDWVHSALKRSNELPEDFSLVQCLFGEHLLSKSPDRIVALVESEKSAIIGAGVYPDYIWLATGGKSQLSREKLRPLKGRTVIMFPDVDAYPSWCEKANEMNAMGINAIVSDVLEKNATPEDREAQIDVADWLIRDLKAKRSPP